MEEGRQSGHADVAELGVMGRGPKLAMMFRNLEKRVPGQTILIVVANAWDDEIEK